VYPWGDVLGDNLANFCDTNCKGTFANIYFDDGYSSIAPIGSYSPNGYGLFDMAGNVSEWVADWYDRYYYEYSPYQEPIGPESGFSRVVRGGSSRSTQEYLQVATRFQEVPSISRLSIGFRCVISSVP
jgi:formylglycine-generating enzyme required for sulfatase activity